MTDAERLIIDYGGPLREQALELAQNIVSLRDAIDRDRAAVEASPLYVTVRVGERHPHEVTRENDTWRSFRNQVKAHADALLKLNQLIGAPVNDVDDSDPLDAILKEMQGGG